MWLPPLMHEVQNSRGGKKYHVVKQVIGEIRRMLDKTYRAESASLPPGEQ